MICKHPKYKKIILDKDIVLYQCFACHLVFLKTTKKIINTKEFYKDYYQNEISSRFHFGVEYVVKLFRFFRAFKLFSVYPQAKSILDIGSGRGWTLYFLRKYYKYKRVVGTQLCKNAVDFSRNRLGLTIYNQDLLEINFNNQKFDFITMWHVLEHVNEPEKYIQQIYNLLNSDGIFLIEVPNYNSWTRKISGKYWLGLDLEYHLSFFTKNSLVSFLKKQHFKILHLHTFSLEYSAFISTSSIISKITNTNHLFYYWLQTKESNPRIIFHIVLFLFIFPISLIINLLLYSSNRGEILLITARKS